MINRRLHHTPAYLLLLATVGTVGAGCGIKTDSRNADGSTSTVDMHVGSAPAPAATATAPPTPPQIINTPAPVASAAAPAASVAAAPVPSATPLMVTAATPKPVATPHRAERNPISDFKALFDDADRNAIQRNPMLATRFERVGDIAIATHLSPIKKLSQGQYTTLLGELKSAVMDAPMYKFEDQANAAGRKCGIEFDFKPLANAIGHFFGGPGN